MVTSIVQRAVRGSGPKTAANAWTCTPYLKGGLVVVQGVNDPYFARPRGEFPCNRQREDSYATIMDGNLQRSELGRVLGQIGS